MSFRKSGMQKMERYCLSPPKEQPTILYQMGTTHAEIIDKYDLADSPYLLPIIRDMERDK